MSVLFDAWILIGFTNVKVQPMYVICVILRWPASHELST